MAVHRLTYLHTTHTSVCASVSLSLFVFVFVNMSVLIKIVNEGQDVGANDICSLLMFFMCCLVAVLKVWITLDSYEFLFKFYGIFSAANLIFICRVIFVMWQLCMEEWIMVYFALYCVYASCNLQHLCFNMLTCYMRVPSLYFQFSLKVRKAWNLFFKKTWSYVLGMNLRLKNKTDCPINYQ